MRIGRRIELAPDTGERRLHPRQHLAQPEGLSHLAAARLGACRVQDLHLDRHAVDLGGIVDHQDFEVAPCLGGQHLRRHLGQQLAQLGPGLARGLEATGADQHDPTQPIADQGGDMARHHPAEGEAGDGEVAIPGDQGLHCRRDAARHRPDIAHVVGRIAVAQPRQVGGIDGEVLRQDPDIADPVDPRPRAAVEQQQDRLRPRVRTENVPHHGAAIAHRHANGLGVGGDGLDVVSSRAAVRHVRDGGIVEGHFRSAPSSRSTKPGACLRSIQRSTVTRSCSGSIQTMWLPQPSAK